MPNNIRHTPFSQVCASPRTSGSRGLARLHAVAAAVLLCTSLSVTGEAQALAAYRQSVLRATEEVENAFSALVNRDIQASTLTKGETSLTQARQSTFIAYQKGTASLIDVLHADETLLQTADARAQARTQAARAAVAAFRALGGGWQPTQSQGIATAAR